MHPSNRKKKREKGKKEKKKVGAGQKLWQTGTRTVELKGP